MSWTTSDRMPGTVIGFGRIIAERVHPDHLALVAAAPDLLAALRTITDSLDGKRGADGWMTEPIHGDDYADALAAIAKAEGRP